MTENESGQITASKGPESEDTEGEELPRVGGRFRSLRRIGCAGLLVIWFAILLLPCILIVLATRQEIVIWQGDLPGQHIRIWLIMDEDTRGLGISTTAAHRVEGDTLGDDNMCLQTNVSYWLWQGKGEPVSFCDCFTRSGQSEAWNLAETYNGACQ